MENLASFPTKLAVANTFAWDEEGKCGGRLRTTVSLSAYVYERYRSGIKAGLPGQRMFCRSERT